jgi:hypothetical protein
VSTIGVLHKDGYRIVHCPDGKAWIHYKLNGRVYERSIKATLRWFVMLEALEILERSKAWGYSRLQEVVESSIDDGGNLEEPKQHWPGVVYFVRGVRSGLIKIGFTTNLKNRLSGLRTGAGEIELLATIPGDRLIERAMHHRFSALRQFGEWFSPEVEIMEYISAVNRHSEKECDLLL